MAELLKVSPSELRRVSGRVDEISSRVDGVVSGLRTCLDGDGSAWGGGSLGAHFAFGPRGYVSQVDPVLGALEAIKNWLDDGSSTLRSTADRFEQSDESHCTNQLAHHTTQHAPEWNLSHTRYGFAARH